MKDRKIWKPIEFDPSWGKVDLVRFNLLYPSWEGKRTEFEQEGSQYDLFIEQLKRRQALNWETPDLSASYDEVLEQLNQKIGAAKKHENGERMLRIRRNMHHAYEVLCKEVDEQCNYIPQKVAGLNVGLAHTDMNEETVKEKESRLNEYATKHTYHINAACPKCWSEICLSHDKETQYRLVFCLRGGLMTQSERR